MIKTKLMSGLPKAACILIAGGCGKAKERDVHNSCELLTLKFDKETGDCRITTENFPSLNNPRRGAVLRKLDNKESVATNNNYLIIGGCSSETNHTNTMEMFDINKKSWTLVPNVLTQCRSCFVASLQRRQQADFDQVIYCCGGWNGLECMRTIDEIEMNKFNTSATSNEAKKTTTSNQIVVPLKNSCCVDAPLNKGSFVIGGWDGKRTLDTIYKFLPSTDDPYEKLQFFTRLPYPVECHDCCIWRNKIFIVGGFDGFSIRNDVSVVDVDSKECFTFLCKLKKGRECHCAEIVDDYLIVAGGWDGYEALRCVEVYKIIDENNVVKLEFVCYIENLLNVPRNRACSIVFD